MKIPQLHFVHFPGSYGGTWWLTADSKNWGEGVKLAYQPNGRHA